MFAGLSGILITFVRHPQVRPGVQQSLQTCREMSTYVSQ